VAAAALVFLLTGSAPAWAHASLLGTDPADGALLPAAPATITLTFSEPVTVLDGGVRLLDATGAELPSSTRTVDNRVLITPGPLGTGTVVVSWQVNSADSHPISGGFIFAVGERSAGAVAVPTAEPDVGLRIAAAAAQAAAYLGVLAACGLNAFDILVLRGRGDDEVRGRIRRLSAWFAGGGVLAGLFLLPLTDLRQRFATLAGLADPAAWTTQFGGAAGLTLVLVGAGVLLAWEAARATNQRTPASAGAALAGCGLALGAFAIVGHTRGYGPVPLVLTADLVHLAVAACWLGGLIGLSIVVRATGRVAGSSGTRRSGTGRDPLPAGRAGTATAARPLPRSRVESAATALTRFSTLAAGLVAVLAVTGPLMAWRILGSWAALIDTGYGRALLVKVALAAVVVGVAGVNRFLVRPAILAAPTAPAGWRNLRRCVGVEAGVLVLVVMTTGWLVNASPSLDTAASTTTEFAPGEPVEQTVLLGTGTLTTRLAPGTAGVNSLEFTLTDAGGQPVQPLSDPQVSVSLPTAAIGPLTRPVSTTGPGAYQAVLDLPLAGRWIVTVSVRTSEFEQPSASIQVDIP